MNRKMMNLGIGLCFACVAALLAASCTDDTDDGTTLPGGTAPMTFTASVDGLAATRATTDNSWAGGENVAIQIGSDVKQYAAASGGKLTVAGGGTPFYWQSTADRKTVSAWYYGTGYDPTPPNGTSWAVQSDQSKTEAGNADDNYQRSDFLYAPPTEISYLSGGTSTALTFYHQTARVVVNIVNAEAATDVSAIQSVVIGSADNLALSGSYTPPTGGGTTAGTWIPATSGSDMGTITPKKLTAPGTLTDGHTTALATYAALVIPQQMKDKKFIAVSLANGNTYYYTPKQADEADLQSGRQHTYDITVKHGYLEVSTSTGGSAWGSDGSAEDVTGNILADGYAPYDLKIGDFYYSDGTTSDGGYRKYQDGSTAILPVMPVLKGADGKDRTVIGIVYSTDVSRIGAAATEALKKNRVNSPHGLVMALTNASEGCRWGNKKIDENTSGNEGEPFNANTDKLQKQYNNVDGYGETHWIIDTYKNSSATLQDTYTAFYHADRYGTPESGTGQYAAPSNTTGWFIPGMGQWWDILSNLGGINLDEYKTVTNKYYTSIPDVSETAVANMNRYLEKISNVTQFRKNTYYWSSSEQNGDCACYVYFKVGYLNLDTYFKDRTYGRVRCVLAF